MNINKNTRPFYKKPLVILVIVAVIAVGGYFLAAKLYNLPPFSAQPEDMFVSLEKSDTEKEAIKSLEKDPAKKVENPQTDEPTPPKTDDETGLRKVNVLITSVDVQGDQVSVSGFVTDVTEEDGVCSYVFVNGSTTVSKERSTLANPTSVTCKTLTLSKSDLPKDGTWNVSIHYKSSRSTGVSSERELKL